MPTVSQVLARRVGRIAFGVVLLVGVACLATAASRAPLAAHVAPEIDAAWILCASWLGAAAASAIARTVAAQLCWSADPEALFAPSVVVPTLGIALVLPITLHMPIVLIATDWAAFDTWVVASLWITGLAHVVFAILCARRGYYLVAGRPAMSPRTIYLVTVITSCVPFAALLEIPPLLVAITAAPFVPMLRAMERLVARERTELAVVARSLPRAVAVPARRV